MTKNEWAELYYWEDEDPRPVRHEALLLKTIDVDLHPKGFKGKFCLCKTCRIRNNYMLANELLN